VAQGNSTIEVKPVRGNKDLETFLHMPWTLGMTSDPLWVPPLLDDYRKQLDPKKSPFLAHGEVEIFLAWEAGRPVGRISVQYDRVFDESWKGRDPKEEDVAQFGFFDAEDRPEVAKALFEAAEAWARAKGRKRLRGPMTLDSKGEMGVLVEGFDTKPRIGTPHNRPYVGALIESAGYARRKDMLGWWYEANSPMDPLTAKLSAKTRALPNVKIRLMDKKNFGREVEIVREIYNEAWKDNWTFSPFQKEEIETIGSDYLMFIDPEIAYVAEVDGKPAAICLAVPDLNEVIKDFNGELLRRPWNILRLLWRLKYARPTGVRLIILGVKAEYRASRKYGALVACLYEEIARRGAARGYTGGELSWTLEDNDGINRGIERMGAKVYKRWRMYEKEL
jgi:GNAT superfamily N-acetyltransferase